MIILRPVFISLLSIVLLFGPNEVSIAQELNNPTLSKSFTASLGGNWHIVDAEAGRKNIETGDGPVLDLMGLLGIDDYTASPRFELRWRPSEHLKLEYSYDFFELKGMRAASTLIEFGRAEIPISAKVNSNLRSHSHTLSLGYSFIKDDRKEVGIGLDLGIYDLSVALSGESNAGSGIFSESDKADVTAPLGTISLYGAYAFNNRISLEGSIGYFDLEYDKYDVEIFKAKAKINYWINERFALGAGYQFLDIDLVVDNDEFRDSYFLMVNGPFLFGSVAF